MQPVITILSVAVLALASAAVQAQSDAPKTRAQVRQELADAIRDGTMPFGESGQTMREMFPSRYAKRPGAMPAQAPAPSPYAGTTIPMPDGTSPR
jgi:hypothetical protein